jgi:predicted AlkP superfamily phosphohydrolase/phosphomutase
MLSNRIWTSAATGVVPERHGVTDFFFDRRSIRVPTMWDLVHQLNGRIGIFEYLVTAPPLAVNGFVLPGWMARNPADTHPPRLLPRQRILTAVRHPWTVLPYLLRRGRVDPRLNLKDFVHARFKASHFLDLYARFEPDLAACIWYGTDRLGHKLWRYHEPSAFDLPEQDDTGTIGQVLPDYYREADRQVGRVVRELDDGRTLFLLMSDHGMGPMDELRVTAFIQGKRLLQALGLGRDFYVESPHSELILNCRVEGREDPWTVPRVQHRQAVESATARLREVRRSDTGAPLLKVSLMDLDKGDLKVSVLNPRTLTHETLIEVGDQQAPASDWISFVEISGGHQLHGILVLAGYPVEPGAPLDDPTVLDIAPTIMHALGLPVAADLDGRVLTEAFGRQWQEDHAILTVPSFGTVENPLQLPENPTEEQLAKLRSLGYIQ